MMVQTVTRFYRGRDSFRDSLVKGIAPLENSHFDLAICCSVMEHVNKPWKFAENLSSLIKVGGLLYISVPWVWRYHPYPDDYWRFSWRGIMELYPGFHWENIEYSTNVYGEFFPASPGNDDRMCLFKDIVHAKRKYLPYLNVNMIGKKLG